MAHPLRDVISYGKKITLLPKKDYQCWVCLDLSRESLFHFLTLNRSSPTKTTSVGFDSIS